MFSLLEIRRSDDARVIHLSGELDLSTSKALEEALSAELPGDGDLVLDLAGLTFLDSTGLKLILETAARIDGLGRLVLQDVRPEVLRVLRIAGVDRVAQNILILPGEIEGQPA